MPRTIIIESSRVNHAFQQHFTNVCWTLKAVSVDFVRRNINFLNSKDGILCCTDGHRLHMYSQPVEDLREDMIIPNGQWELKIKNAKQIILVENEEGFDFSDYWRVFPLYPKTIGTFIMENPDGKYKNHSWENFVFGLAVQTGRVFNLKYLRDAFMPDQHVTVEISEGENVMLTIGNETLIAGVMGLIGKATYTSWKFQEAA